ncbi:circularly permutated Ras protein 1 isoform X2 [Xenopus tropicalis]|uniref:Circularly permutated Ras protein 1 isoform X2 n=1 Tax=Xenopus tropicalis TaxID=8364 RepID=A0A8J0SRR7_XENTR|nr:circularly permutated Ras protein 1 isoform X2 [Xenopus tropicalis]|eukprot:XP_012822944.1 PREDICTED: circularly permutated Ras protein 1-like isoform X2 [Xenopus tropicalis]
MEFGCRYIYVNDKNINRDNEKIHTHLPSVEIHSNAQSPSLVTSSYDNFIPIECPPAYDNSTGTSVATEVPALRPQLSPKPERRTNGPARPHSPLIADLVQKIALQKATTFQEAPCSNALPSPHLNVQPSGPTERKTPPPIPERRKKPSMIQHQDVSGPGSVPYDNFRPTEESQPNNQTTDVYYETPLDSEYPCALQSPSPELERSKTPPPVPERKKRTSLVPPTSPQLEENKVKEQLQANCNVLLLNLGKLVDISGTANSVKPTVCCRCSAALSKVNPGLENQTWCCAFCGCENTMPAGAHIENFTEDQICLSDPLPGRTPDDDSILIFCVDISGSMSVTSEIESEQNLNGNHALYITRMEALKAGLLQSLDYLYNQHPKKRVVLITFSDQVMIYGDGTSPPHILDDTELLDPDYLRSCGETQPMPHTLEETLTALKSRIGSLYEMGATALGPAALVSIAMAAQKPGSKVIICTDGRANTYLGNLDDIAEEHAYQSSRLFYSNLANLALQHSVVVSVLTIERTDCRLHELGQLADKTGGKVNIVHPLNLAQEFQSILEEEINATDVKVRVYLPSYMYFVFEGHSMPVLERAIGSTTPDTVLSLEFDIHSTLIQDALRHSQLPVQVQLTFCRQDGRRGHRILTQRRPVTNDCLAALEALNMSVLQIHSAQISAHLAMEGRVEEATKVALALKGLIAQIMKHEKYEASNDVYEEWENTMSPIYEDLQVYGNSIKRQREQGNTHVPAVKGFTDEMANMMFHLKQAKNKVMKKLKHQAQ